MDLPDTIKYLSSKGSPPDGLINAIKNVYHISNPLTSGIINLSPSSTDSGNVQTVVLWNSNLWQTKREEGPYVQFRFPERFVFLSGYSLKGNDGGYYSKKWRVDGFNEGEENNKTKWTLLARNTSAEKSYCGRGDYNCGSTAYATYSIKSQYKGFQYIRFTGEEASNGGGSSCKFATSAIELYGILSKTEIRAEVFKTHKTRLIYISNYIIMFFYTLVCSSYK